MTNRILTATAAAVLLATAGCASANSSDSPPAVPVRAVAAVAPPLVGTEWQLASYRDPGSARSVTVRSNSTAEFSSKGGFTAHACNHLGGGVTRSGDHLTFTGLGSTDMACGGEPGRLEQEVEATLTGTVAWAVTGRVLTLANPDGHRLTYRVRPSIYPDTQAKTILSGNRAGGQYRLTVAGTGPFSLEFEYRTAPGESWGQSGIASPGPTDCLADEVTSAGSLGGMTFGPRGPLRTSPG